MCRFYYWQLSLGVLQLLTKAASESAESETDPDPVLLAKFRDHQAKADIYHAYHHVRRYVEEPFTSLMPEDIFHMSRFVVQSINKVAHLLLLQTLLTNHRHPSHPRASPVPRRSTPWPSRARLSVHTSSRAPRTRNCRN